MTAWNRFRIDFYAGPSHDGKDDPVRTQFNRVIMRMRYPPKKTTMQPHPIPAKVLWMSLITRALHIKVGQRSATSVGAAFITEDFPGEKRRGFVYITLMSRNFEGCSRGNLDWASSLIGWQFITIARTDYFVRYKGVIVKINDNPTIRMTRRGRVIEPKKRKKSEED